MPDTFGALTLPVPVPGLGETVSDPALDYLAAFFASVIQFECGDAWREVAPGETLIRQARTHDPRSVDLSANLLPCLFVFRTTSDPQRVGDEWYWTDSTITCLWVFPPADHRHKANLLPIFNGLEKAIARAFGPLNGRHPAWVVAGDTDTFAARYGSSLLTHCGFTELNVLPFRHAEVKHGETDFRAVQWELKVREEYAPAVTYAGAHYTVIRRDAAVPTATWQFDQIIAPDVGDFSAEFSSEFY